MFRGGLRRGLQPGPTNARRAKIDQQLKNVSGAVHDILELDSMMATLDIVRRGERISILPGCLCLTDLDDPNIVLYPIESPRMTVDYLLIEPAAKTMFAAAQHFAAYRTAQEGRYRRCRR